MNAKRNLILSETIYQIQHRYIEKLVWKTVENMYTMNEYDSFAPYW